ncbi:hypothetical protein AAVH_23940 [Aphelenchoides avenae]|nr:hypothetical protein AAVH_23940 [Aphelenchus avenae]
MQRLLGIMVDKSGSRSRCNNRRNNSSRNKELKCNSRRRSNRSGQAHGRRLSNLSRNRICECRNCSNHNGRSSNIGQSNHDRSSKARRSGRFKYHSVSNSGSSSRSQKNQPQTQYGKNDDSWMPRNAFVPGLRTAKYSSDPSQTKVFWNNEADVGFELDERRGLREFNDFHTLSAGEKMRVKGHSDILRGPKDNKESHTDFLGEMATDLHFAQWDQVGKGGKAVVARTRAGFNKIRAHVRGGRRG